MKVIFILFIFIFSPLLYAGETGPCKGLNGYEYDRCRSAKRVGEKIGSNLSSVDAAIKNISICESLYDTKIKSIDADDEEIGMSLEKMAVYKGACAWGIVHGATRDK